MNTLDAIFNRKSIRKYTDQKISKEDIETILKAGMAGPSAVNARPWSFIVVEDRETLNKMADGNGKAAQLLKEAPLGILVCGDIDRTYPLARDYWVIDGAIACQNMILAATELGIGSVWLGTYPQDEKVKAQSAIFDLPESIIPHSIIAFGYAAQDGIEREKWEAGRVHYEKW